MDFGSLIGGIVLSGIIIFLIGHSFIDSFFDRKEELINKLSGNERGEV